LPNDDRTPPRSNSEPESLKDQATHILDEARTVLPGIQALFGFQLIAVFSDRFATGLSEPNNACILRRSCSWFWR